MTQIDEVVITIVRGFLMLLIIVLTLASIIILIDYLIIALTAVGFAMVCYGLGHMMENRNK